MRPSRPERGDEGSALVLALFMTVTFSLFIAQVITFAEVGLKAASGHREARHSAYASDGALDAAVQRFRTGGPCDDHAAPSGPDGRALGGEQLVVRCQQLVASSRRGTSPAHALLALGTDEQEGISTTASRVRVRGDVFSHSRVTVAPGGTFVVEGEVAARRECAPTERIRTLPEPRLHCANTDIGADPVRGLAPDLDPLLSAVPVARDVPPCPAGWLVELAPGFYQDGAALSALTDGGCPGRVVWLRPGRYYLDLGFRRGSTTWAVTDPTVTVVAGTPKGWSTASVLPPLVPVPGACRVEGDPAPVDGVHLVFGGDSRLHVDRSRVELCARPSSTDLRVAVHGLGPSRPVRTLRPTSVPAVQRFVRPERALLIGEARDGAAEARLDRLEPAASITLNGFRSRLPDGAVLDTASLRISHREEGDPARIAVRAEFAGNTCGAVPIPPSGSTTVDRVDLAACGLTAAAVGELSVTHEVALVAGGDGATALLDGIWLDVSFRAPTPRAPSAAVAVSGFADVARALHIGEQPAPETADAHLGGIRTQASLTFVGFGDPPLPKGAALDAATLRVSHHEDGAVGVRLVVTFADKTCRFDLPPRPLGLGEDLVDLGSAGCGLSRQQHLDDLRVTYSADLARPGGAGMARLDGVRLDVVARSLAEPQAADAQGFDQPHRARRIDGSTSDASLSVGMPSASVVVSDFARPPLPASAALDRTVLRVAHQAGGDPVDATLEVSFGGGGCERDLPRRTEAGEDHVDLQECGLVHASQLATLAVTYRARLAPGARAASAGVDGVVLDVGYRQPVARTVTGATASSATFVAPEEARRSDGTTADVTLGGEHPTSAALRLAGYDVGAVHEGSVLEAAAVRVSHRLLAADPPDAGVDVDVELSIWGQPCGGPRRLTAPGGSTAEELVPLDVVACGLQDPAQLAGLEVTYVVQLRQPAEVAEGGAPPTATVGLDGLELDTEFSPPALRALRGCSTDGPYPAVGCALLTSTSFATTRLVVEGTIYAPTAAVDIAMTAVTAQILTRGVIARTIRLGIAGAPGYDRPTVVIPPEAVQFTVYPRHLRSPAAASGERFRDPDGALAVDGRVSRADLAADGAGDASLTLTGYGGALAAHEQVDGAVLVIAHRHRAVGAVRLRVTLADGSIRTFTSSEPCSVCVHEGAALAEHRIELVEVTAAQLATVTATYEVTLAEGAADGSAEVDGLTIEVFSRPFVRARAMFDRERVVIEGWNVLR